MKPKETAQEAAEQTQGATIAEETAESIAAQINHAASTTDDEVSDLMNEIDNIEEAAEEKTETKTKKESKVSTKRKAVSFVKFLNFLQGHILKVVSGNQQANFSFTESESAELSELAEDFADDINIPSWVWFGLVLVAIEANKIALAISMRKNSKKNLEEKSEENFTTPEKKEFHEPKTGRSRFQIDEKNFFIYDEIGSTYLKKTDRRTKPTAAQMAETLQANPNRLNQLNKYFADL